MRWKSEFDDVDSNYSEYPDSGKLKPDANAWHFQSAADYESCNLSDGASDDECRPNQRSRAISRASAGTSAGTGNNFGGISVFVESDEWSDGNVPRSYRCGNHDGEDRSHASFRGWTR